MARSLPRISSPPLTHALPTIVETRMSTHLSQLGASAGGLSPQAAQWTGLPVGTPVAVANVDAHVTNAAVGAVGPGEYVMIMGTSTCDHSAGDRAA